jgi:hypothetical protein
VWTGPIDSPDTWFIDALFGDPVHRGGDLDGDGLEEVLAAAPYADDEHGAAYVLRGPATGDHLVDEAFMEIAPVRSATGQARHSRRPAIWIWTASQT